MQQRYFRLCGKSAFPLHAQKAAALLSGGQQPIFRSGTEKHRAFRRIQRHVQRVFAGQQAHSPFETFRRYADRNEEHRLAPRYRAAKHVQIVPMLCDAQQLSVHQLPESRVFAPIHRIIDGFFRRDNAVDLRQQDLCVFQQITRALHAEQLIRQPANACDTLIVAEPRIGDHIPQQLLIRRKLLTLGNQISDLQIDLRRNIAAFPFAKRLHVPMKGLQSHMVQVKPDGIEHQHHGDRDGQQADEPTAI